VFEYLKDFLETMFRVQVTETNISMGGWGVYNSFRHVAVESDFAEDEWCSKGLHLVESF